MQLKLNNQNGFTLVELAIALIIIGLLIAGVLKGHELVDNARLTQSIRQVREIETAVRSFQATYIFLPGDIRNPASRLPRCSDYPCNVSGDANNRIEGAAGLEVVNYWLHLSITGFLTADTSGQTEMTASPDGVIRDSWYRVRYRTTYNNPGNYIVLLDRGGNAVLTAAQAARIDQKIDDGRPMSGDAYSTSVSICLLPDNTYPETNDDDVCDLNIKID